jgi:hypothetical protein
MSKTRHTLPALVCGIALSMGATAQMVNAGSLPPEQQSGDVSWVSGGIGEDSAASFKAAEPQYPLAIEMSRRARPRNEYVSDAEVSITDTKGQQVLNTKADGPYMLVKLPPGTYRVEATLDGKTVKSGPLRVESQGLRRAVLSFPVNTDNGGGGGY